MCVIMAVSVITSWHVLLFTNKRTFVQSEERITITSYMEHSYHMILYSQDQGKGYVNYNAYCSNHTHHSTVYAFYHTRTCKER